MLAQSPSYLHFVLEHIDAVVLIPRDSRVDLLQKEYRTTRLVAFTDEDGFPKNEAVHWYASSFIHEAQHVEQLWIGAPSFGAGAENDADRKRLEYMENASAPQSQIEWVGSLIECRNAGGCNTWDDPHEY